MKTNYINKRRLKSMLGNQQLACERLFFVQVSPQKQSFGTTILLFLGFIWPKNSSFSAQRSIPQHALSNLRYCLLLLFSIYGGSLAAQCGNDNIPFGFSEAPTQLGESRTLTDCLFGGEYRVLTNLQAGATYRIGSCGDADFDTQLSIYDHNSAQALAYNDDYCGLQSQIDFVPPHNGDYRILVDEFFCESNTICMTISAMLIELPAVELVNDDCIHALPISCNVPTLGSTQGAKLEKAPYCGTSNGVEGGVWYRYEGEGQAVSLTTCMPGTRFDTKLRVYEGSCEKLICVAGNDDGSPRGQGLDNACFVNDFGPMINRASTVNWEAQAATTYFILVHGFSSDAADFELLLECVAQPVL